MKTEAKTPDEYIDSVPDSHKATIKKLRSVIKKNLPEGFEETMNYSMIGYVVPHSKYPKGYHADPKSPLPFINIASQKNHISLYHMGIYTDKDLLEWFRSEYPKYSTTRPDMGKSCIRFKKPDHIPFELIGMLVQKVSVDRWISLYESVVKK